MPSSTLLHCVIGSGPAGISTAKALLEKGAKVLLIDAGYKLEPHRKRIVEQCATIEPVSWTKDQIALMQEGAEFTSKGINQKLLFGSDFPYKNTEEKLAWINHGTGLKPSLAAGGLSNVWGAAILPYRDSDIESWPIGSKELELHYKKVLSFMDISGIKDDLEQEFPLYNEEIGELKSSSQAEYIINNLNINRKLLNKRGWLFGKSRLALNSNYKSTENKCIYCGSCMFGCPYNAIYSSNKTLSELLRNPNFSYEPGRIVKNVREFGKIVKIIAQDINSEKVYEKEVSRVYLAAGALATSQIILRSQSIFNKTITLKDSQYFLIPFVLNKITKNILEENLHSLSQVFIEINNKSISTKSIHLQVYTYNKIYDLIIKNYLGPLNKLSKLISNRVIVIQGYLHSDDSSSIEIRLEKKNNADLLHVASKINPEADKISGLVSRELLKYGWKIGGIALPWMRTLHAPGKSYHYGSSFPMSKNPVGYESDILGRPFNYKRIHAVDASILPSIPGTTITLAVMANAHRIGWETANLD